MLTKLLLALACSLALVAPALAQSAPPHPLNLDIPPSALPTASASTHRTPHPATASSSARSAAAQPGKYYGDTSGRPGVADASDTPPPCDDSSYNQPQVHGSVGMGVVAGNHVSGNYQSGSVRYSQAFGSCEHPTGHVSISVGVGQGHVDGGHWRY
jgi:hypothetical protein